MVRTPACLGLLGALVLVGCGSDDHGYFPPPGPYANVQFLHASPDAPPINVIIDGQTAIPRLNYGQGTGEQSLAATTHTFEVQTFTPGTPTTVIPSTSLAMAANMDYVVAAEGAVASIGPVVFPHPLAVVPAGSTRLQILHAAPSAPALSVFLTAPGADLSSSAPFGTASFQGSLGPTSVTSGSYELRVTASGTVTPVLYDSGTITLPDGSDVVFAALENTGPGVATLTVSGFDALGNQQWFPDVSTPSALRVVHDSADAPGLSVIANGNTAIPLVATISYEASSAYLALTPDVYDLAITPASNTSDVLAAQTVQLWPGVSQTLYAFGPLASIAAFMTHDDTRRYATQAKLRVIQGAPTAGTVDVYLTATGTGIASAAPTYASIPFGTDTGFVSYVAGNYDLIVTPAGSKTPLLGPIPMTLKNAGLYTEVARDAAGGGAPYGLIELDDSP
jgi:Domain of unknown function (DUF4397)